ncbi:MAG TPA: response regulator [Blastocatellia bacterium]|jgi:DNA-binding NtrC family response regulator
MTSQEHTILVVDDEPANLRMFERLLRHRYRVVCATGAEKALAILKSEKVSVLISDHRMPGMTGVELLRESIAIDANLVRMIVTGDTGTDTFLSAIKHGGAICVIRKPWDPDELLKTIANAIEKYELTRENKKAIADLQKTIGMLNKPHKPA